MAYVQHRCPTCSAPLPPPPPVGVVRCSHCEALLAPYEGRWRAAPPQVPPEPLLHPDRPRLWLGGARYALRGRLARGDGSDVFLGWRDRRLTELVVVKVLRSAADRDRLERERDALAALHRSTAQGAAHFTRLLPQPVGFGAARLGMRGDEGEREVGIHRWRSGFVHTFEDVERAHPGGVAPEAAVWMWKRILELLGFVHASGWVHGAVLPSHLLVHARDHGVVLCGWSRAVRAGEPLAAAGGAHGAMYPADVARGAPATPATDVTMGARAVLRALGGGPLRAPSGVPRPLADLLEAHADPAAGGRIDDAWWLKERVAAAASEVFGPPRYVPFEMPGWSQ